MYSPLFVNFWTRSEGLWNKYINSVGCPWDGWAIWRLLILPDTEEEELGEGTLSVIFAFMCLPYPISNLNNFIFPKLSSIKGFHSNKQTTITYWELNKSLYHLKYIWYWPQRCNPPCPTVPPPPRYLLSLRLSVFVLKFPICINHPHILPLLFNCSLVLPLLKKITLKDP